MLIDDVERYLALRRSLGFKLDKVAANLRAFAGFATSRGHEREGCHRSRVVGDGRVHEVSCCRLGYTVRLATFLRRRSRPRNPAGEAVCGPEDDRGTIYLHTRRTGPHPRQGRPASTQHNHATRPQICDVVRYHCGDRLAYIRSIAPQVGRYPAGWCPAHRPDEVQQEPPCAPAWIGGCRSRSLPHNGAASERRTTTCSLAAMASNWASAPSTRPSCLWCGLPISRRIGRAGRASPI